MGYKSVLLSACAEITRGVLASSINILSTSSTIANASFLKQSNEKTDDVEPKVIVVKQAEENIKTDDSTSHDEENTPYNNPYMYAYPPEYYYDDEYDDEYDEDEDE